VTSFQYFVRNCFPLTHLWAPPDLGTYKTKHLPTGNRNRGRGRGDASHSQLKTHHSQLNQTHGGPRCLRRTAGLLFIHQLKLSETLRSVERVRHRGLPGDGLLALRWSLAAE